MTPQRFLALIAVTGIAAATGFLAYRALGEGRAPAAVSAIAAGPAAAAADAGTPSAPRSIPTTLPAFTLQDREGVPRTKWSASRSIFARTC